MQSAGRGAATHGALVNTKLAISQAVRWADFLEHPLLEHPRRRASQPLHPRPLLPPGPFYPLDCNVAVVCRQWGETTSGWLSGAMCHTLIIHGIARGLVGAPKPS